MVEECHRDLADSLANNHPSDFLVATSLFHGVGQRSKPPAVEHTGLWCRQARSDTVGLAAMAYATSRMVGTDEQQKIVEQALGSAVDQFPGWLRGLGQVVATQAWVSVDELASTTAVGIGIRFVSGEEATLIGLINLDLGVVPLDVSVFSLPAGAAAQDWLRRHERWTLSELALADARAQWQYALMLEQLHDTEEFEDWRNLRPLIDWVLSLCPDEGGQFHSHGLPAVDVDHAVLDFLRSPDAADRDDDTDSIVRACLGARAVWHDPLRWSALAVELFLLRTVPRWHALGRTYLIKVPDVLAALIRHGHQQRGVDPQHTEAAMQAIDEHTPGYLRALEGRWARHGTEHGVAGTKLLALLEQDSADEISWGW